MRDINFFSPYIKQNKTSNNRRYGISLLVIVIVGILSSFYYWSNKTLEKIEEEITESKAFLESEKNMEDLKMLTEKKQRIEVMKKYKGIISSINQQIDDYDIINRSILNMISSELPQDTFLQVMSIDVNKLDIIGLSSKRLSIAELEHNLKELDIIQDIHVHIINQESNETDNYVFNMECTLKDVDTDEAE